MKITAQDEFGLRILLRIAKCNNEEGISIPKLSSEEGISQPYVAKITRLLRMNGYITSTKGHKGGYVLSKPAKMIKINKVLKSIGGNMYCNNYCSSVNCTEIKTCVNSNDCSVRALWKTIQLVIDQVLDKITLQDMVNNEKNAIVHFNGIIKQNAIELINTRL